MNAFLIFISHVSHYQVWAQLQTGKASGSDCIPSLLLKCAAEFICKTLRCHQQHCGSPPISPWWGSSHVAHVFSGLNKDFTNLILISNKTQLL